VSFNTNEVPLGGKPPESDPDERLLDLNKDVEASMVWSLSIIPSVEELQARLVDGTQTDPRHHLIDVMALRVEMKLTVEELSKHTMSISDLLPRIESMTKHARSSGEELSTVVCDALDALHSQLQRAHDSDH
jgi:hypothetical protein